MSTQELKRSIEHKLFFFVTLLVASNAYFVQRIISSVDMTTQQVNELKQQVARIETRIEDLAPVQKSRWKKL